MQSKITLMAFEESMNYNNDSLFANIAVPDNVIKDDLINNIILRAGEFECIYNDPMFMKQAITLWSKSWLRTFNRWVDTLNKELEINPLENYDRYENISKDNTGTVKSEGESDSNAGDKVSAYNSSEMQDSAATEAHAESDNTITNNLNETIVSHLHGNIGVTTSSQLLTEALEVARFNLYNQIADVFIQEFCILIY